MAKLSVGWWASDGPLHLARGRRLRRGWSREREITVPTDHRTRHAYVLGSTGSGKSRFTRHLLYQDVRAGRGFTLIDPHGDLAAEVLSFIAELAIPGEPTAAKLADVGDKVVIIEPHDQRYGVPTVNLLRPGPGQAAYSVVDALLEIIKEIWQDSYGARLEDLSRNALLLLQELNLTLLEIVPLLCDAEFRANLVARSRNPDIRLYFGSHLAGLRPAEERTWIESSRNKWHSFLASPYIRPMLACTEPTIDFREILDDGKILIVRISRDRLKESRRLLGALLINQLHQAALTREDVSPERRIFHAVYCDEFAEVWTPTFSHILGGGRKYGLALVMLHQNLTQAPFSEDPSLIDGVVSNTHTRVIFNVSHADAERLAGEVFQLSGSHVKLQRSFLGIPQERPTFWSIGEQKEHYVGELQLQQPTEAFISFKGLAGESEPYIARVPAVPDVRVNTEKVDLLRQHAARQYARPLAEIEREIVARWTRLRIGTNDQPRDRHDFNR